MSLCVTFPTISHVCKAKLLASLCSRTVWPESSLCTILTEKPVPSNAGMDFVEKSRIMLVLNRAYAGSVVDRYTASAAIREFQGLLDELYHRPPTWEMVTMKRSEVDAMRDIIKFQDERIKEITERINKLTHGEVPRHPLPTETDRADFKRRLELADMFNAIYDNQWKLAYSELQATMRWRDIECIYTLMRVVRSACDMCIDIADEQLDKLLVNMEDVVLDPVNPSSGKFKRLYEKTSGAYTEGMKVAEKFAISYRTERAESSAKSIVELFMDTKMRGILDVSYVKKEFRTFTERCVHAVWLMTTLNPPMRIYWQNQTERVNTDFFDFYERKGDFVNQTVWPATFLHNTGRLIYKGFVLAM